MMTNSPVRDTISWLTYTADMAGTAQRRGISKLALLRLALIRHSVFVISHGRRRLSVKQAIDKTR
ncbi:hypothetical protein STBA_29830 [Streptomyces sp. MP131-18]|nr:hypothetical protein STBA_29830 [Streptomyces sp. MP131-18]